jgi:DNA-binding response OmpR family regulator
MLETEKTKSSNSQKKMGSILIVDDDKHICRSLSTILQTEGYTTISTNTASSALEELKNRFFDIALIDIMLPDIKGTKLLEDLKEISPNTITIIVTGYPSIQTAIEALNKGADSYLLKPIDPRQLLQTIEERLKTQQHEENITKKKVMGWLHSQAQKRHSADFSKFLEETAAELNDFGLTINQSKTFTTITVLGVASASEIARFSGIRREEIYRMVPKLEKLGLVTESLQRPRRYSAIRPEDALKSLTRSRVNLMREEINRLSQKQAELVTKFMNVKSPIGAKETSPQIEVISKLDNLTLKLGEVIQNMEDGIEAVASHEELKYGYLVLPSELLENLKKTLKINIITELDKEDAFTKELMKISKPSKTVIEIRHSKHLPYTLMIADGTQAFWGKPPSEKLDSQSYWTNDPQLVRIMKAAFDNLWQKSTNLHLNH